MKVSFDGLELELGFFWSFGMVFIFLALVFSALLIGWCAHILYIVCSLKRRPSFNCAIIDSDCNSWDA